MKDRLVLAVAASLVIGAGFAASAQEPSMSPTVPGPEEVIVASPSPADVLRGTWDYELTDVEVESLAASFGPEEAAAVGIPGRSTSLRMAIDGDEWWLGFVFDGELWLLDGVPEGDGGTQTVDGDRLTQTNGHDGWATYEWSLEGDQLTLTLVECVQQSGEGECPDVDGVRWMTEHTYTSSGTDPSY
jgi:hypothetical protein